jgi:hypothetical protein
MIQIHKLDILENTEVFYCERMVWVWYRLNDVKTPEIDECSCQYFI